MHIVRKPDCTHPIILAIASIAVFGILLWLVGCVQQQWWHATVTVLENDGKTLVSSAEVVVIDDASCRFVSEHTTDSSGRCQVLIHPSCCVSARLAKKRRFQHSKAIVPQLWQQNIRVVLKEAVQFPEEKP